MLDIESSDGLTSATSVERLLSIIEANEEFITKGDR